MNSHFLKAEKFDKSLILVTEFDRATYLSVRLFDFVKNVDNYTQGD